MQERYEPAAVEAEAQNYWDRERCFEAGEDDAREKYYCLSMFPYPSGRLHMGHVRNYTIGDVLSRFMRMNGRNVLQPMGWDAFGLPAENAAMANGVPPAKWTFDNIAYMKAQLKSLGFALDWSRELTTCRPEYYRWNQWLFLRMLEKGIAYQKTGVVNWDPVDRTVLANEQVIDGRGWRTGALIEKREIPMYYLKITSYAEDLLEALNAMPGWPERVRAMQANWIGKSDGRPARLSVRYRGSRRGRAVCVYHARRYAHGRDVLRGGGRTSARGLRRAAITRALRRSSRNASAGRRVEAELATQEKKGMPTGLVVRHPISGEPIPVWVGNYVLMSYGDGAVMGVPAHDERDFEFAKKYQLPIKPVIDVAGREYSPHAWAPWYADHGRCINSGAYDGLEYQAAVDAIAADLSRLKARREANHLAPARLGHLAAALLGLSDPGDSLRKLRHRAGAGRATAGGPAGGSGARRQRQSAAARTRRSWRCTVRSAAARRGARPTPWTRSWIRPGISCGSPARTTITAMRSMRASGTGCRWINTSAASSTRFCTCCTRASGRGSCGNWDWSGSRNRSPTCSPRAWC